MESSALDSVRWDEGIFWRGATPDVTPPTHSHTGWTVLTDAIASVVFARGERLSACPAAKNLR
ncbi:hypothetical protein HYPGJ_20303 [Hyphomicrobium sp. GJ21]|nr:hypothetical protein HYPGJ_20303 [Hyphomicrobium sp. GJ21]